VLPDMVALALCIYIVQGLPLRVVQMEVMEDVEVMYTCAETIKCGLYFI
jgi:hypothetical protein